MIKYLNIEKIFKMSDFLNPNFILNYKTYNTITENFKPLDLNNIISHENLKLFLLDFVNNEDFPNILLYGLPGIGKSCLIEACLNELYGNKKQVFSVIKINASEKRGTNMIKTLLTNFLNTDNQFTESGLKIVILDEADNLTQESQNLIKSFIDNIQVFDYVKFVLICNYENKISESLKCRCFNYKLNKPTTEEIIEKIKRILCFENLNISTDAIKEIINYSNNDIRNIYNVLQCLKLVYGNKPIFKKNVINYLNISSAEDLKILLENIKTDKPINVYKYPNLIKLIYDIYENVELNPKQIKELANLELIIYKGLSYTNFYIYLKQILILE